MRYTVGTLLVITAIGAMFVLPVGSLFSSPEGTADAEMTGQVPFNQHGTPASPKTSRPLDADGMRACRKEAEVLVRNMPKVPGGVNYETLCRCAVSKNQFKTDQKKQYVDSLTACMNSHQGTSVDAAGSENTTLVEMVEKFIQGNKTAEEQLADTEEQARTEKAVPRSKPVNRNYKYDPKTKTWSN